MPNIHTTAPLQLTEAPLEVTPARIDVEIAGLRHGGASFEVRLFLDNAEADVDTPPTPAHGYLGKFSVFGHGGCFGEDGHCTVRTRRPFDPRPIHALTPMTKVVTVTRAFLKRLADVTERFTLTLVADPVPYRPPQGGGPYLPEFNVDRDNLLHFDSVRVVTYD